MSESLKVIGDKRVLITDDEYDTYNDICKSYDTPTHKGSDLFKDLFETDERGIMVFIRPPRKRAISFEIFFFILSIFNHQHVRLLHRKADAVINQIREELSSLKKERDLK